MSLSPALVWSAALWLSGLIIIATAGSALERRLLKGGSSPEAGRGEPRFPRYYDHLHTAVMVLLAALSAMASLALFAGGLYLCRSFHQDGSAAAVFMGEQVIVCAAPAFLWGLYMLMFLPGAAGLFSAGFGRYQALRAYLLVEKRMAYREGMRRLRKAAADPGLADLDLEKLSRGACKGAAKSALIIWCATGPLVAFAAHSFVKVTPAGIVTRPLFHVAAIQYGWSDLAGARLYTSRRKTRSRGSLREETVRHFEVAARDGRKMDLWPRGILSDERGAPAAAELMARNGVAAAVGEFGDYSYDRHHDAGRERMDRAIWDGIASALRGRSAEGAP